MFHLGFFFYMSKKDAEAGRGVPRSLMVPRASSFGHVQCTLVDKTISQEMSFRTVWDYPLAVSHGRGKLSSKRG